MDNYSNHIKASLLCFNSKTLDIQVIPLDNPLMRMGRANTVDDIDIPIDTRIASARHGDFFKVNGDWFYKDTRSTNGTFIDGRHIFNDDRAFPLQDGTILKIQGEESGNQNQDYPDYIFVFCEGDYSNQEWTSFPIKNRCKTKLYLGRDPEECEFLIDSPLISKKHGLFYRNNDDIYYSDLHSTNGTFVNGDSLKGFHKLEEKDIFLISNQKMIYINGLLFYMKPQSGTNLSIRNLSKHVNDSEHIGKKKTILHNINLDVSAAELVAILGTSGAGKSTFLNCINGYESASEGSVLINNIDLVKNKKMLKKQIGYVPQEDLLRDGLSVKSTLNYTARLRLPKDTGRQERFNRIDKVLDLLGIEPELKSSKIQKLSGGQRKRISIAMELISDPPIIFLDEPTSGLDPETETMLIEQLRKLAHVSKKTLLVITHTLKNIELFDKVLFLGPGGKACYYGSPALALNSFRVKDFIELYPLIRENTDYYANLYYENFRKNYER